MNVRVEFDSEAAFQSKMPKKRDKSLKWVKASIILINANTGSSRQA